MRFSAAPHPRCTNDEGPRSAATCIQQIRGSRHAARDGPSTSVGDGSQTLLMSFGFGIEALVQQPHHPTSPWLGIPGSSAVSLVAHGCGAWSDHWVNPALVGPWGAASIPSTSQLAGSPGGSSAPVNSISSIKANGSTQISQWVVSAQERDQGTVVTLACNRCDSQGFTGQRIPPYPR